MKVIESKDSVAIEFEENGKVLRVILTDLQRTKVGGKADLLRRALGKIEKSLKVIDATGGLLRDAMHLADLGCEVTVYERNTLLAEALTRALKCMNQNSVQLVTEDFCQAQLKSGSTEIVFLDPMFPDSNKTALSGKETRLLQLLGEVPSVAEEKQLLQTALRVAKRRVIVKRPRLAPPLAGLKPSHFISGRAVRYDVYIK